MKKLLVFLVSDYALILDSLELLINSQPNLQVIGKSSTSKINCGAPIDIAPDVIVKDMFGPMLEVIYNIKLLQQAYKNAKIVIFTDNEDKNSLKQLSQIGISACIPKSATPQNFILTIRSVGLEDTYLPSSVLAVSNNHPTNIKLQNKSSLSGREETVLNSIALGYSQKEIATNLNISIKTVETYKYRLMEKLGLRSLVDILKYALNQGWLHLSKGESEITTKPRFGLTKIISSDNI